MKTDLGTLTYLAFFAVFAGIQARQLLENRGSTYRWDQRNGTEAATAAAMPVFFAGIPLIYVFSPILDFADRGFQMAAYGGGIFLGLASVAVFVAAHRSLGRNWSHTLQVKSDQQLITSGVYRLVRHPVYSALLLYALAQVLLLPNWIASASYLVGFGLLYVTRVANEERMMQEAFGKPYADYMARTPRVIPNVLISRSDHQTKSPAPRASGSGVSAAPGATPGSDLT